MWYYILKFSACLLIFFLFYKTLLENHRIHQLKRYYLLLSLILSLVIPFITFTNYNYVETPLIEDATIVNDIPFTPETINEPYSKKSEHYPYIIWSIYGIVTLGFLIVFSRNLFLMLLKIKKNSKIKKEHFTHVLLKETTHPHTFFNYIISNKEDYEGDKIPEEVFTHEAAHAHQKHSIDILFIEILNVLFWFHPFIYLFKKAIKLNHEFLADEAVLQKGIEPKTYQQTLLAFSSNAYQLQLANAINYSLIKKRFIIMKTQTSKRSVWLRSLLLIPLLMLTVYGFSNKVTKEVYNHPETITTGVVEITIEENNSLWVLEEEIPLNNISEKIKELKPSKVMVITEGILSHEFGLQLSNEIQKAGVNNILFQAAVYEIAEDDYVDEIDPTTPIKVRADKIISPKKIDANQIIKSVNQQQSNPETGFHQVNGQLLFYTNINSKVTYYNRNGVMTDKNGNEITPNKQESAYDILPNSKVTKVYKNGVIVVEFKDDNSKNQDPVTPKEIARYNALAKKYGKNPKGRILLSEVNEMKRIYNAMNKEQRAKAAPMPNFPPPPPPPPPAADFPTDDEVPEAPEAPEVPNLPEVMPEDLNKNSFPKTEKTPKSKRKKKRLVGKMGAPTTNSEITVNGKKVANGKISLTKKELMTLKLKRSSGKITSYKIKFVGNPTQVNKGSSINEKAKSFIKDAKIGSHIYLFDIKNSETNDNDVVLIVLK